MKTLNSYLYLLALGLLASSCASTSRHPIFEEEADVPPLLESDVQSEKRVVAITSSSFAGCDEGSPTVIDENLVAFVSDSKGRSDIWYMEHNNSNRRMASELVSTDATEKAPFVFRSSTAEKPSCFFVTNSSDEFQVFSGALPKVQSQSWEVQSLGDANWPHMSADGSRLLYSVVNANGEYVIWIHDMDGGGDHRLTVGQRARFNPTNDEEIVFVRRDGDSWNIWKFEPDGAMSRLVQGASDNFDPEFSPDGHYIAYTSNKSGSSDIWVMMADGSKETQVTVNGAIDCQPTWTLDGQALLFASNRAESFDIFRISVADLVGKAIKASSPVSGD